MLVRVPILSHTRRSTYRSSIAHRGLFAALLGRTISLGRCLLISSMILGCFITEGSYRGYARPLGSPVPFERIEALDQFFKALDDRSNGRGRVRISHIGDSHIIADFWTGEMRERLQRRFGNGGRGFVLGGKVWRSFSQKHIGHRTQGDWKIKSLKSREGEGWFGPGGCVMTSESARDSVEIYTKEGSPASEFDRLSVFTLGAPQGGRYLLSIDDVPYGQWSTFSPWLTIKRHDFELFDQAHTVYLSPQHSSGIIKLFGFSLERSEGGLIYDAIGLNGAQAKHLLKNHDAAFQESIQSLDPTLIIFSFGINELFDQGWNADKHARHLTAVFRALREGLPETNCLITGPFAALRRRRPLPEMSKAYENLRRVAEQANCGFWNAEQAMGMTLTPWQRKRMAQRDGVHLNIKGYHRIAQLFEGSLLKSFEQWRERHRPTLPLTPTPLPPLKSNSPLPQSLKPQTPKPTSLAPIRSTLPKNKKLGDRSLQDQRTKNRPSPKPPVQHKKKPTSIKAVDLKNKTSRDKRDEKAKKGKKGKSRKGYKGRRPSLTPSPEAQRNTLMPMAP